VDALQRAELPDLVLQHVIRDQAGEFVAQVDAAYPDQRIALEYDSYLHHGGRAKFVHDLARRNDVTALGWRVLHFTNNDLQSGGTTFCALRAMLAPPQLELRRRRRRCTSLNDARVLEG
jgi:very-short-patch-repair endonuclease